MLKYGKWLIWKALSEFKGATDWVQGALATVCFFVLLFNRQLGERLESFEGISPAWSLVPIGAVFAFRVFRAGHLHAASLQDQLNDLLAGTPLAARLRSRKSELEGILASDGVEQDFRSAFKRLEDVQQLVIALLNRPEARIWRHRPQGWDNNDAPLPSWSALSSVMQARYPGEIIPQESLYTEIRSREIAWIEPVEFDRCKSHSLQVLGLAIRELERPADTFPPEDPQLYRRMVDRFGVQPPMPTE
ncbi:MAG: hypothetical protein KF699_16525 [Phycisphaeraceae bacterium]|nr:hypothetical protein [Phycisphaeraceae bacterium]